jgi:hypothetical protein
MKRLFSLLSALRGELRALWLWWVQELRECTEWLLELGSLRAPRLRVRLEHPQARVCRVQGEEEREIFTFTHPRGGPLPALLANMVSGAGRGARVTLVLGIEDVLLQDLTLPEVAEPQLEQLIRLKLERELPLGLAGLCVDHWVVLRRKGTRQILVRVLIAHRAPLERLREQLTAWGWRLVRVGIADEKQPRKVTGDLLPARGPRRELFGPGDRRLLLGAAALLAAWGLAVLLGWGYERIQVGSELRQAEIAAGAVRQLRARLERDSAPARALIELQQRPDAADGLPALTDAVPLDSWVSGLDVTTSAGSLAIRLSAFTPVATLLADQLSHMPSFHAVRLLTANSAGLGSGDRLELSASFAPSARAPGLPALPGQVHQVPAR